MSQLNIDATNTDLVKLNALLEQVENNGAKGFYLTGGCYPCQHGFSDYQDELFCSCDEDKALLFNLAQQCAVKSDGAESRESV
ncbi:hypothetical protein UB37_19285 [Photobacterium iliopiscarium]|jgi:hypothetical protein|uniref:Uncharacterized protein n=1 Tax=Photobacterium iliopiscarium TaxID=56192 RepID=A0ABX5GTE8_9GAMM|nr:hypothetical protein [Photobacterium iliopiscarium]KJG19233.1 hypothetical protein UB37_19285 [Photobacterium iliopiscarium]PSW96674.1 hypothetical protein C9J52_09620 [Photobacterium iliopiscarium]